MKLVFLGPPGAGKGTQAVNVAKALSVPHISTGDMFRAAISNRTKTGLEAKAYTDSGALVPDSVTIKLVEERLLEEDCHGGYLLDGFPRTVSQAEALEKISAPDKVIEISVPDEKLLERLTGRRVCPSCKGTFHVANLKDAKVCPVCAGALIHREDDQKETISKRLCVYHEQTQKLISFYAGKGVLLTVNGDQSAEAVGAEILKALENKA